MKRTIRLTESELHSLIRECIEEIIYESRQPLTEAFQSQKLAQIVLQHGGLGVQQGIRGAIDDGRIEFALSDLRDRDILGVYTPKEYYDLLKDNPEMYSRPIRLRDGMFVGIRDDYYSPDSTPSGIKRHFDRVDKNNDLRFIKYRNVPAMDKDGYANTLHFQNPHARQYLFNRNGLRKLDKKYPKDDRSGWLKDKWYEYYKNAEEERPKILPWHHKKMGHDKYPAFTDNQ